MNQLTLRCTAAVALATAALAQRPEDGPAVPAARGTTPAIMLPAGAPAARTLDPSLVDADPFTVPIHTAQDDNGHRYGVWASGPDYKVSFDGGMAFYPVLGDRYPHNLPLAWKTAGVRVGTQQLLESGEQPSEAHEDWRYDYRFAAFTERYELLPTGVEQKFVIHARPAGGGDLVIRGIVDSELVADPCEFAHRALTFRHADGTDILRYGEAFAIDAAGRTLPMETAFDGEAVSLRLDGDWLETARFPLTVDPLLSRVVIGTGSATPSAPSVGRDDTANDLLFSYGRQSSGGDYDLYARLTDDTLSGTTVVYSDVTASWSTRYSDVAFVGGPDRWIIVMQRDFGGTTGSWIRYHLHDSGDTNPSTSWNGLAGSNGNTLSRPQVGGTDAFATGDNAFVVYQSDTGLSNSSNSEVYGHLVDVANATVGTAITLESGASFDCESPAVNQVSSGGSASWICCWSQLDNSINDDDWDLIIARVDAGGTIQGRSWLGDSSSSVHAYQPKVAGRDGRYMAVFGEDENGAGTQTNGWAPRIRVHRFDWAEGAGSPTRRELRTVRAARTIEYWSGDIAYDSNTDSHWSVVFHSDAWDVYTARVGYDAGICESATVYDTASNAFSPSITFNDDADEFVIGFAANEGTQPVYGVVFDYPAFAQPVTYGVGCGPATIGSNTTSHSRKPHSGAEFFEIRMSNVPTNALGALNLGLAPAGVPIPFLPGCFQNADVLIVSLPASAVGTTASVPLPIPGGVSGDLFLQYIYVDPGFVNPIPVRTSQGLQVFIR